MGTLYKPHWFDQEKESEDILRAICRPKTGEYKHWLENDPEGYGMLVRPDRLAMHSPVGDHPNRFHYTAVDRYVYSPETYPWDCPGWMLWNIADRFAGRIVGHVRISPKRELQFGWYEPPRESNDLRTELQQVAYRLLLSDMNNEQVYLWMIRCAAAYLRKGQTPISKIIIAECIDALSAPLHSYRNQRGELWLHGRIPTDDELHKAGLRKFKRSERSWTCPARIVQDVRHSCSPNNYPAESLYQLAIRGCFTIADLLCYYPGDTAVTAIRELIEANALVLGGATQSTICSAHTLIDSELPIPSGYFPMVPVRSPGSNQPLVRYLEKTIRKRPATLLENLQYCTQALMKLTDPSFGS